MSDSSAPSIREVRYQWVEFMCTFAGLGKKRYYEDLFDSMLDKHNREVAAATLGQAKTSLDLDDLASVKFTAADGHPSVAMNTNAEARDRVLKGLDNLAKQYRRGAA